MACTVAAAAIAAQPAPTQACGGFFCNQPGGFFGPLPVAQTGENVLFAVDEDPLTGVSHLEAHIQIFYTGPVDKFSWVLPVDGNPKLDVGSNQVFTALDTATMVSHGVTWTTEGTCKSEPTSFGGADAGAFASGGAGGASAGGAPRVDIAFRGDVGPFDAAVIRSDDPAALTTWLVDNGYYVSDVGETLIQSYVSERKYFVALKLLSGKTVGEIRPIVLRFDGPGPCIPLKLTAIAALDDMRVNLWVIGRARVVPTNFAELTVNEARIDWLGGGRNYPDLLKEAANEAGGNAFTTEYAGPASVLRNRLVYPAPNSGTLMRVAAAKTPPEALMAIQFGGFSADSTLLGILRRFIPVPAAIAAMGVTETVFYNQLAFYWQTQPSEFASLDAPGLAAALETEIVKPLREADALFARYPKLTRLATFISPDEMVLDPLFTFNASLPDVPNNRVARGVASCGKQAYRWCEAPRRIELPSGGSLYYPAAPCFGRATAEVGGMPALERAWRRTDVGEGELRVDNRAKIATALAQQVRYGAPGQPTRSPGQPLGDGLDGDDDDLPSGGCTLASGGENDTGVALAFAVAAVLAARRRGARRPRRARG